MFIRQALWRRARLNLALQAVQFSPLSRTFWSAFSTIAEVIMIDMVMAMAANIHNLTFNDALELLHFRTTWARDFKLLHVSKSFFIRHPCDKLDMWQQRILAPSRLSSTLVLFGIKSQALGKLSCVSAVQMLTETSYWRVNLGLQVPISVDFQFRRTLQFIWMIGTVSQSHRGCRWSCRRWAANNVRNRIAGSGRDSTRAHSQGNFNMWLTGSVIVSLGIFGQVLVKTA